MQEVKSYEKSDMNQMMDIDTSKLEENKKTKSYEINKEKVVEFITENSQSEALEMEVKSTCVNFQMNSGTYHILIMKHFVNMKEGEHVEVDRDIIKCLKNEPRYDKNNHNVEHLVYFETDKNYKAEIQVVEQDLSPILSSILWYMHIYLVDSCPSGTYLICLQDF